MEPDSGEPVAVASRVLGNAGASALAGDGADGGLQAELQEQQLETGSRPHQDLQGLGEDLSAWRARADQQARSEGARVAALATSPLPVLPETVDKSRYERMAQLYGLVEREQLTCGCHVHVSVDSEDEAVGVLDRIRVWLPLLTAISANSPFWQGHDTGYASYRTQVWARWPSSGPIDVQGTPKRYHALVRQLLQSGAAMDEAMIYFDARLSSHYPTVEVRVPDVCQYVDDALLVAGLVRAMVDTAAWEWRDGTSPPDVPAIVLRAAGWRAARWGMDSDLIDPDVGSPQPAAQVLEGLLHHVEPALRANGDAAVVCAGMNRVLSRGNGANRQRLVHQHHASLHEVVLDAIESTQAPPSTGSG